MISFHQPVLLNEVVDLLQIKPEGKYIDATIGGGGHTAKILSLGGRVLGIDLDQDALDYVGKKLASDISGGRLILAKGNFGDLAKIAHLNGFGKVDGVLFDLGVSSYQIDTAGRGFSFLLNGPLDMRMDRSSGATAEALVNLLGKRELSDLFGKYGQERLSRTIAKRIVQRRKIKAIKTTEELWEIIAKAYGIKGEVSDFTRTKLSQKVFQALRIAVNQELENLALGLPESLEILEEKGRIAVITFHSLEDGIVKRTFLEFERKGLGKQVIAKPLTAGRRETEENPRSKSAKLRVFTKELNYE